MIPTLTRRAVARRGLAAALAGAVAALPARALADDPYRDLPPGVRKAEPELDPDWRAANERYWADFAARNAAYWRDPAFGDANAYFWAHCAPGAPQPLDCAPKPPPPPPPAPAPARVRALDLARQYLGTPYVWGGETPAGWDCSGFVRWVYGQCGVALPRTAAEQYDATARCDPTPGDLVFFAVGGDGVDHVGLYAGAGAMLSALNPDLGTRVSAVWGPWWAPFYVGAGRV